MKKVSELKLKKCIIYHFKIRNIEPPNIIKKFARSNILNGQTFQDQLDKKVSYRMNAHNAKINDMPSKPMLRDTAYWMLFMNFCICYQNHIVSGVLLICYVIIVMQQTYSRPIIVQCFCKQEYQVSFFITLDFYDFKEV